MKPLEGKIAAVTGADKGIGFGIATVLAKKGADIIINGLREEDLIKASAELSKYGGRVDYIVGDISNPKTAEMILDKAISSFGGFDIAVNNAGINIDRMMHKMTFEEWQRVLDVNLSGVFYLSKEAVKFMRTKEYGRIINIASASWEGNIGQANYAASKAGVIGLTKTIAKENAKKGITCNAICPGFIDTDMTRAIPAQYWDAAIKDIPMGHAGKPEDIGNMVAFLASDEAAYITAEVINVGGGYRLA